MSQTKEQIEAICLDWQLNHAPEDLILRGPVGEANSREMGGYFLKTGKEVSTETLNAAVATLGDYMYGGKLRYRAPKVVEKIVEKQVERQPTAAEIKQKQQMERSSLAKEVSTREWGNEDANYQTQVDAQRKAEQAEKQAQWERQIANAIDGYNAHDNYGRVNYARTESRRHQLRQVASRHSDKEAAYKHVRAAIAGFPD